MVSESEIIKTVGYPNHFKGRINFSVLVRRRTKSYYIKPMSHYFDNRANFMEPEVVQYCGSHPVMTNVMKPLKKKYVNFDTRFSKDTVLNTQLTNPNANPYVATTQVEFPERIQNVRSIEVKVVEIPLSFYNFSHYLQNTTLALVFNPQDPTPTYKTVQVPDGYYTSSTLSAAINTAITGTYDSYVEFDTSSNLYSTITFTPGGGYTQLQVLFDVDSSIANTGTTVPGSVDRSNIKSKLGWAIGFRQPSYLLTSSTPVQSEANRDMNGPRYLYLAIDEFNNSAPQTTFLSMLPNSLINRNILARISVDSAKYNSATGFGTIQTTSYSTGYLMSDTREYADDIDLQKLGVQLVDEYGRPISLNGLDYSFALEVVHT
jgi:hypothetical protein